MQNVENAIHYSELTVGAKNRPGPKKNPNALVFRSVGLMPSQWDTVAKWASDNEREAAKQADKPLNLSPALGRAVDDLAAFRPMGPGQAAPRDARGLFLNSEGRARPARTSRAVLAARVAELERALIKAGIRLPDGKPDVP